jgi:hypothetical protein
MPEGFIGKVSVWIYEEYVKYPDFFYELIREWGIRKVDKEKFPKALNCLMGCFSEYLVFEHRPFFFLGKTGAEYFAEHNPLTLAKEEIGKYKQFAKNHVGVFPIKKISNGKGFYTHLPGREEMIFVEDKSMSKSLESGKHAWIRISRIDGKYFMVSSIGFTLSEKEIQETKNDGYVKYGARFAYNLFYDLWQEGVREMEMLKSELREEVSAKQKQDENKKINIDASSAAVNACLVTEEEKQAEQKFAEVRKRFAVEYVFPIEKVKEWIRIKPYDPFLVMKILLFFIPETIQDKDLGEYMEAGKKYVASLGGADLEAKNLDPKYIEKIADNILENIDGYEDGVAGIGMQVIEEQIDHGKVFNMQRQCLVTLKKGDHPKTKKMYTQFIKYLLENKIPFYGAFRVFANASNSFFALGEYGMCLSLLRASKRLNSKYAFADRSYEVIKDQISNPQKYIEIAKKEGSLPQSKEEKEKLKMHKNAQEEFVKNGGDNDQDYNNSVFKKYEDFLTSLGLLLTKEIESKLTQLRL